MDFRKTQCAWCKIRTGPLEDCMSCPKYFRYGLNREIPLTMESLCPVCINRNNTELEVFCRTNRFHQQDSGEDFECYNFCIDAVRLAED
jgi:hypothetical protein